VSCEARVPAGHLLRAITDEVLSPTFAGLYSQVADRRSHPKSCSAPCCCRLFI